MTLKILICAVLFILMPMCCSAENVKRIAVLDFDSASGISNWWSSYSWGGNFRPGEAVASALTTRLANSSKFVVVEREALDAILREQKLGASGAVSPETASEMGRLIGARYLVIGTVTEFSLTSDGGGGNIRVPIGGIRLGLGGKANKRVRVSCECKVVDTVTGAIVMASSARKDMTVSSGGLGGFYRGYELRGRGGELPSSALGKGIYEVAQSLANDIESGKFKEISASPKIEGYVLEKDGHSVFLNFTAADRVCKNMVFKVMRSKSVRDPRTGQLRTVNKTIGKVKVIDVSESSTECEIISEGDEIQAGDKAIKE